MAPRSRLTTAIRARAHSVLGWTAYQLGWAGAARRRYERVLVLRGADFRAYVQLGRIAFDQGDYAGWRREFEHARRTDPARFARLQHPLELFEPRLAGTRLEVRNIRRPVEDSIARGERATWSEAERTSAPDAAAQGGDDSHAGDRDANVGDPELLDLQSAGDPFGTLGGAFSADGAPQTDPGASADPVPPLPPDASVTHDDFSSASERRRFELRRPIDQREIARCNLNDLARRLSG